MRKTFASSGVLVMGVLVALAALGVVYGLWSKNLVINGTVHTGDLNADWDAAVTNDPGGGGVFGQGTVDPTCSWPGFPCSGAPDKQVGSCDVAIGDPTGAFGNQIATVTILNAYPSYQCTIRLLLTNTGTIPFNITGSNITGLVSPLEGSCTFPPNPQVDPNQEAPVTCTVHLAEIGEGGSEQGQTYRFDVKVCVAQWNEAATYGQCVDSPQHEGPK